MGVRGLLRVILRIHPRSVCSNALSDFRMHGIPSSSAIRVIHAHQILVQNLSFSWLQACRTSCNPKPTPESLVGLKNKPAAHADNPVGIEIMLVLIPNTTSGTPNGSQNVRMG